MSCSANFPKVFPLECIQELARDLMTGVVDWKRQVKQASWVVGCSVSLFDDEQGVAVLEESRFAEMTDEDLGRFIHDAFDSQVSSVRAQGIITPELILALLEMLLRYLSSRAVAGSASGESEAPAGGELAEGAEPSVDTTDDVG